MYLVPCSFHLPIKAGFNQVFEHKEALTILARSLDPKLHTLMSEVAELLAAVCLVNKDGINGHDKVLEAITVCAELNSKEDRFAPIIEGMQDSSNVGLRLACMQLINALITNNEDLDFRLHLRNEFFRTGFYDIWEDSLLPLLQQNNDSEELNQKTTQTKTPNDKLLDMINVFNNAKDEDFEELTQRYDNIRFELDDIDECSNLIRNSVRNSPAENHLLSIFQHLLLIRDDVYSRYVSKCLPIIFVLQLMIFVSFILFEDRLIIDSLKNVFRKSFCIETVSTLTSDIQNVSK